jgi:alpha-L-rhamnosidase
LRVEQLQFNMKMTLSMRSVVQPFMKSISLVSVLTTHLSGASPVAGCLRCEYHASPLAIGTTQPRFSWKLTADDPRARGLRQTAYEIQVARSGREFSQNLLWTSGKVASAASDQVVYAGKPLASRDRAVWRVRIWGTDGEASPWSEPASFGVGLLAPEDWSALWISSEKDHSFVTRENIQNFADDSLRGQLTLTPAKYFRKDFEAPAIVRATLSTPAHSESIHLN